MEEILGIVSVFLVLLPLGLGIVGLCRAVNPYARGRRSAARQATRERWLVLALRRDHRIAARVLIGQRPQGVPLAGYWEFPGGKILAGESPEEAAARECREETGLEIRVGALLSLVEHQYEHGRVRLHFFAAEPLEASRTLTAPFGWVPVAELASYRFPPANADVMARMCEPRMD